MPLKSAPNKTWAGERLEARAIIIPRHNKPTVKPEIPDAKCYGEIPAQYGTRASNYTAPPVYPLP